MGRISAEIPCVKNPDLPCLTGCRLRNSSNNVFQSLAKENKVSLGDIVRRIRGRDPVEKSETRALIDTASSFYNLEGSGITCENEQMGRIGRNNYGVG